MTAENGIHEEITEITSSHTDAALPRKHVRGKRLAVGLGVFFLLAALAAVAVVLVLYFREKSENDAGSTSRQETGSSCDDVAIIGAGIAGTYAAWKLRHQNMSITVYEYSNRTGGRLHTVHLPEAPDINVELGGMRFFPEHRLISRTAHELGLAVVDFDPGFGFSAGTIAYLRGVHLRDADMVGDKLPYGLKPNEKYKTSQILAWELFSNGTNVNTNQPYLSDDIMEHLKTKDGTELYQQSCAAAYTKLGASSEAVKYIRDVLGIYSYSGDVSAALTIPRPESGVFHGTRSVKTVKNGMNEIPKALMKQFLDQSENHHFIPLHELKAIERRSDKAYDLSFMCNEIVDGIVKRTQGKAHYKTCAKKVILAVTRQGLEHIEWSGLKTDEINSYVTKSVKDAPAAKVFLVYDQPWWRNTKLNFSHAITDLPNRQSYDFGISASSSAAVLLGAYADMDDVKLWRELHQNGGFLNYSDNSVETPNMVNSKVIDALHRYLADLHDIPLTSIPTPLTGVMSLWDKYPNGGAWSVWMPGFIWKDVQTRMVKPSDNDEIYTAINAFAPGEGSGWSETALESVELVLDKMNI